MTEVDSIRTMTDGELAAWLVEVYENEAPNFCRNLPECDKDLEDDREIPKERCVGCMLKFLQRTKEGNG